MTDGTVTFDTVLCTGCGLCLAACPFGVIGWTADSRYVHQCDLCADRRAVGQEPVCALTCPTEALSYEEYGDFVGRVQHRAAAKMLWAEWIEVRR
jgi:Fe-S-cluster-containing dehydrogenase component